VPVLEIPAQIDGLGASSQRPRINPGFDPTRCPSLTSEDFYAFSRIDGNASLRELVLMLGLGVERGIGLLSKLHGVGAFLLEGETAESVASRLAELAEASSKDASEIELDADEVLALSEDNVLAEDERIEILLRMRAVRTGDPNKLLGVSNQASIAQIKKAHRRLSKRFHPDRYYGKDTGSFGPRLALVFESLTKAWSSLQVKHGGRSKSVAHSRKTEAAAFFERATAEESQGRFEDALKLYDAASQAHSLARYLRRAATCAMRVGLLDDAERYAREALEKRMDDPSYWRVLADVLCAAFRLQEAEEVLVQAAQIKTENDVLAAEIASDLAEVRRQIG